MVQQLFMNYLSCLALRLVTTLPALAAEECRIAPSGKESVTDQRWTGPCKDGWAEGVGVLEKKGEKGWRYEGPLLRGQQSGHGYIKFDSGVQYEGAFLKGDLEGMAIYLHPNGDRYDGEFKASLRDGRGSMSYGLGGRYDGNWKNGKYHGRGIIEYPGGRKLDTTFVDGLPIGQRPVEAAASVEPQTYDLKSKEAATGSIIPRAIVTGSAVPLDKAYGQLTPEQRNYIKEAYPLMDEADEPPYPLKGEAQLHRWLGEANRRTHTRGLLALTVMVDSEGKAVSVTAYATPDQAMTDFASRLFLLEKFKPALCAGTPCAMAYPFLLNFVSGY